MFRRFGSPNNPARTTSPFPIKPFFGIFDEQAQKATMRYRFGGRGAELGVVCFFGWLVLVVYLFATEEPNLSNRNKQTLIWD